MSRTPPESIAVSGPHVATVAVRLAPSLLALLAAQTALASRLLPTGISKSSSKLRTSTCCGQTKLCTLQTSEHANRLCEAFLSPA